jgi:hypothetical protein
VLTVHVKCARKLHFSSRWRRNLANIYVRLENNELVKETRAVSDGHGAPKWNQVRAEGAERVAHNEANARARRADQAHASHSAACAQ